MTYQPGKPTQSIDERILAAARALLASDAGADFTMDQLAAAAGVSRASLYRRVGGKQALLDRLAAEEAVDADQWATRDVHSAILQAARTLFGRYGLVRPTMEQIAQEAGVGVATVYRHFGDKAGLVRAFAETFTPQRDLQETTLHSTGDVEADLVQIVAALLRFLQANRDIFRLSLMESRENQQLIASWPDTPKRTLYQLRDYFQQQMDAGRLLPGNAQEMALALLGMMMAFGFFGPAFYDLPLDDPEKTAHVIVNLFLQGVM